MIIYPALDLRGGKVVRLKQGNPNQQTVYSDDPIHVADRWIAAGAEWLHVVNLDGAFDEENGNEQIVEELCATGVPIQFGGGLRSLEDIARAFDLGVTRVVLGTMAVQDPGSVEATIARWHPDAVAVALDARDGIVTMRGWQENAGITALDLGKRMTALGARHALYTDVSRDGELSGVNVAATVTLARETGLQVIASGGVTSHGDVVALQESAHVAGCILGTALYEGLVDLAEAIRLARGE
ncbi:MAG TPA: 1-(5-phosphoribosyl)-5-[(5-phosphoribosylamino)methylideneamino]imidazole-4-carboxamide isomerase [Aggregatilineales bacterium]|nr:1-(5-phosphoribosyl)-5-[(5-phosphoribosylamino)methylideneamino]imidazole-4-carboxamide isomerase [Anaerolineales bacterium]HRE48480.1 1-(5-phosphoribosyl)-5-[(5-phosphoribosylamino)methylideneamino]imidazole-4-carboxamide isomerase [Aggregatilineales bacterium]